MNLDCRRRRVRAGGGRDASLKPLTLLNPVPVNRPVPLLVWYIVWYIVILRAVLAWYIV